MATIIEGLRKIKSLTRRIDKNKERIRAKGSVIVEDASTVTEDFVSSNTKEVNKLLQSTLDLCIERSAVQLAIQAANNSTKVEFNKREMTLAELLNLRRNVIPAQIEVLKALRRAEKSYSHPKESTAVSFFDTKKRDDDIDMLEDRLIFIDTVIDQSNATVEY